MCTEQEIKSVANAVIDSGLFAVGWNRINLDDCWEDVARDANNNIQADPTRFPSGMKSLGDWLHARNLSFGIYTSLGYSVCNLGGHSTHPPGSYTHEVADAKTFASWGVDFLKGEGEAAKAVVVNGGPCGRYECSKGRPECGEGGQTVATVRAVGGCAY